MALSFRSGTVEDLELVYQFWQVLMNHHDGHHPVFELAEGYETHVLAMLEKRLKDPKEGFILCFSDETPAGMLVCYVRADDPIHVLKKKGYVAETAVFESFRGLGIGKKLTEVALAWLKEQGADHVELQVSVKNKGAEQFWEKMGFTKATYFMVRKL